MLRIPTYDKTMPFSLGPSLKYSIATIENIDWNMPKGIPQIHFTASRYATLGIFKILNIFLTLSTDESSPVFSVRVSNSYNKKQTYKGMLVKVTPHPGKNSGPCLLSGEQRYQDTIANN